MNKLLQLYLDNAKRDRQLTNFARNGAEASLYIYDIIAEWAVSAAWVASQLAAAGDAQVLHVYINSPGGSVFEGRAIMAELARFGGKKIGHIDSLCASAATGIALACNEIEMTDGAFFMIHNASAGAWGDKNDLRKTADLLEKIEVSIVNDYVAKTGKDAAQVLAWMDAETWFNATEALEHGFIDRIVTAPAAQAAANNAAWDLAAFKKAPAALAGPAPTPAPAPSPDDDARKKSAGQAVLNRNRLALALAA